MLSSCDSLFLNLCPLPGLCPVYLISPTSLIYPSRALGVFILWLGAPCALETQRCRLGSSRAQAPRSSKPSFSAPPLPFWSFRWLPRGRDNVESTSRLPLGLRGWRRAAERPHRPRSPPAHREALPGAVPHGHVPYTWLAKCRSVKETYSFLTRKLGHSPRPVSRGPSRPCRGRAAVRSLPAPFARDGGGTGELWARAGGDRDEAGSTGHSGFPGVRRSLLLSKGPKKHALNAAFYLSRLYRR